MPLTQAKCTNCGANLEIDNTKDAAICPYCGTAFIVEKAINNYNTTNQIHADTVNIYGGNSADFVIRGGVLVKYNGAATEVVVPNGVKIIGGENSASGAFKDCIGITSVLLPDSVQEIGDSAFEGCIALTSVTIPNSLQKIGALAFKDCKSLASVTLPDSVQEIGNAAFGGCSSLTSVTIPNSVQEIGLGAFDGCSALASVVIPDSVQEIALFSGCSSLTSVTIPDSVQEIGNSAFLECSSLTSISIPSSVKRIDEFAFEGCSALRKVKIDGNPEISSGTFGHTVFEKPDIQIVEASEEWKKKNWGAFKNEQQSRNGGCYVATAVYAPTTARRSGRCGDSATIRWIGHGMAARLSAPITPSVRRWCAGLERRAGSAACSKRRSTAWSGSCGGAAYRIRPIRINIEKDQKPARSNDLAGFVCSEENAEPDLNTAQESKKKIHLCAWISIAALILCATLCALAVLWSR